MKSNSVSTFFTGESFFCLLIAFVLLTACNTSPGKKNVAAGGALKAHTLNPAYAKGFTVYENNEIVRLTSRNPDDTTQIYKVLDIQKKNLPYKNIAISSTTHSFLFDAIGGTGSIKGMSAMSYLQDKKLFETYKKNGVVELGKDDNLNREIIIQLAPDILMVYPCNGCDYSDYEKAGIIVVNNAEYLEQNPLGRAEWIKVAGLITGKEQEAMDLFANISNEYNTLKKRINEIPKTTNTASVILGKPIDNIWHVPGNNSFAAQLIRDAGLLYAFDDVKGNNVTTKSSEWILSKSANATYWVFTDYSTEEITLNNLGKQNKLYQHLNPYKLKNVIVCNAARDDFFGKAVIEPHVLLRDLVYHFYPSESNYIPVYFKKPAEN
jgi:iron complex transport system substrate-binding protein